MGRSVPSSNRESISIWCFGIARSIPELVELEFTDTNTSSVLATELAQPRFVGGLYTVGNDEQSGVTGNAVQIYGGGTGHSLSSLRIQILFQPKGDVEIRTTVDPLYGSRSHLQSSSTLMSSVGILD